MSIFTNNNSSIICRSTFAALAIGVAILLTATPSAALDPPHDDSNTISCSSCHAGHGPGPGGGGLLPRNAAQEATCLSCHNPLGQASTMVDVSNHVVNGGTTIVDCGSCHNPHGPHNSTDPHTTVTAPNLSLIRSDTQKYLPAAVEPAILQQDPEHFAFAEADPPWNGICQTCHTATAHHTNDGSADHDHYEALDCMPCHTHTSGFLPVGGCNVCHGNVLNAAPPLDTSGNSSTALTTVGAHQAHNTDGTMRLAVACSECHIVPATVAEPTHIEVSPAEVTFGDLSDFWDVLTPDWNVTTAGECTNTYCHGATLAGGTNKTPTWTSVGVGEAACGTCHGVPPGGQHPQQADCQPCHDDTITAFQTIDVASANHIDGILQVTMVGPCDTCHGSPPNTGAHLAHYGATPADASYGGTGMTQDVLPGNTDYAFDCGNCHPLLAASHGNGVANAGGGTAEVDLSPVGAPPASIKAMHLGSATYTPGGSTLVDADGFTYTVGGTCADVYCHSQPTVTVPGPVDEPVSSAPGAGEFLFTTYPIDYYPAYTETFGRSYTTPAWNGTLSCDGCHGFPLRTADPAVLAGAGNSHSWIDDQNYENLHGWNMGFDPLACATCHYGTATSQGVRTRDLVTDWSIYQAVPIDGFLNHVNGQPDVVFTTDNIIYNSTFNLAAATYNDVTETCSNVSCHLNDTSTVWGRPYRWWNNIECNNCHRY